MVTEIKMNYVQFKMAARETFNRYGVEGVCGCVDYDDVRNPAEEAVAWAQGFSPVDYASGIAEHINYEAEIRAQDAADWRFVRGY
jgi:hypothetical protein